MCRQEVLLCAVQVFTGHSGPLTCGQFTPDGRAVVTGGGEGDCTLRVWDPKSGACVHTIQGGHFHSAGAHVAPCLLAAERLLPSLSRILQNCCDSTVRCWSLCNG